jgi:hypothetical protein
MIREPPGLPSTRKTRPSNGRLGFLFRRLERRDGRCLACVDRRADAGCIVLGQEPLQRPSDEGRVAEIGVAVAVGGTHCLHQKSHRRRRTKAKPPGRSLQDVEDFADRCAAGARRRRRKDAIATVGADQRGALGHPIISEILRGQNARRGIDPVIPAKAEPIRSTVPLRRFRYDAEHDILRCPRGKILPDYV